MLDKALACFLWPTYMCCTNMSTSWTLCFHCCFRNPHCSDFNFNWMVVLQLHKTTASEKLKKILNFKNFPLGFVHIMLVCSHSLFVQMCIWSVLYCIWTRMVAHLRKWSMQMMGLLQFWKCFHTYKIQRLILLHIMWTKNTGDKITENITKNIMEKFCFKKLLRKNKNFCWENRGNFSQL